MGEQLFGGLYFVHLILDILNWRLDLTLATLAYLLDFLTLLGNLVSLATLAFLALSLALLVGRSDPL